MRAQHHRKTTWRSPARDPEREKALNWRLDPNRSVGLAGEFGTHQFDVIQWFTGSLPTSVVGRGAIRAHDDGRAVPDTITAYLQFDDGATLQYSATLANSYDGRHELLLGTNAAIKLAWTAGWMFKEADAPTQGWEVYANRQQFHNDEGITLIADATKLASQGKLKEGVALPNPPLYYALADFVVSAVDDKPPVTTMTDGVLATLAGIAANQAILTNQTVDVPKLV